MKRLTKEYALEKINLRIEYLNKEKGRNLEFIGFKNKEWKGPNSILLIKCLTHNSIKEVKYRNFLRDRISDLYCDVCISERCKSSKKIKFRSKEDIMEAINNHINLINSNGYNISFSGFKDESILGSASKKEINIYIKCNIHNTIREVSLYNFLRSSLCGCFKCLGEKTSLRTNYQIYEELSSLNPEYDFSPILEEPDLGSQSDRPITAICPKHGKFTRSLAIFRHKNLKYPHCDECRREMQKEELRQLTEEKSKIVIECLKNRSEADIEFLGFVGGFYNGNTTLLKLKCNKCGYIWETTAYDKLVGNRQQSANGCPSCARRKSQSEEKCFTIIKKKIDKNKIERQHFLEYEDNFGKKRRMFIDFYISDLNMIIEYNGKQHYEFSEYFFDSIEEFKIQQERDQYLVKYCSENNIKLLVITYLDNKRLEEVISKFIDTGVNIATPVNIKSA